MSRRTVLPSLLRQVQADAARTERERLSERLGRALQESLAADARTTRGRQRAGLAEAAGLVDRLFGPLCDGPWDEEVGFVDTGLDAVEVGVYVDAEETHPVRLRVTDGDRPDVDAPAAHVWLTDEQAAELVEYLQHARRRAVERREALP